MWGEGGDAFLCREVPEFHGRVIGSGEYLRCVRREVGRVDGSGVSGVHVQLSRESGGSI